MPHRKAARVFPDPVGDKISVFSPEAIFGHPNDCGGVGATNDVSNQARTAGEKGSSAASDTPKLYETAPGHGEPIIWGI